MPTAHPIEKPPPPHWGHSFRKTILFIFAALCVNRLALLAFGMPPGTAAIDTPLIAVTMVATGAVLSRWLPAQNWITVLVLTGWLSGLFEWAYSGTRSLLPTCAMAATWTVILPNARGTAQWILRRWRSTWGYGFWLLGISGTLTAIFMTVLTQVTSQTAAEHSFWISFVLRLGTALLILIANTTLLIPKRPITPQPEKDHLILWLSLNVLLAASAASVGHWRLCAGTVLINAIILCLIKTKPPTEASSYSDNAQNLH